MSDETGRTGFHYGFYAAMRVEYGLICADIKYEQEYQLGKEPVRLDFAMIKNSSDTVFSDPIGSFFGIYNLFEYKSPDDSLTVDDFYKSQGYAALFKISGYDNDTVNIGDISFTLMVYRRPVKLFDYLVKNDFTVTQRFAGIYKITGGICVKTQIVVISELEQKTYPGIRLLSRNNVTKDDVYDYIKTVIGSGDDVIKKNAGTVLHICFNANRELARQIKEEKIMSDYVRDLWKDEFDKAERNGREEGRNETEIGFISRMLKSNVSISNIIEWSGLSYEKITEIARNNGITAVTS